MKSWADLRSCWPELRFAFLWEKIMRSILFKYARQLALLVIISISASASEALAKDPILEFINSRGGEEWSAEYVKSFERLPVWALGMPEEYQAHWEAAVKASFSADAISAALTRYYSDALSPSEVATMGAFFASDLAQEILRKEKIVNHYTAEDYREFEASHSRYGEENPERQILYEQIAATQTSSIEGYAPILRASLLPFCDAPSATMQADYAISYFQEKEEKTKIVWVMMVFENFSEDDLNHVIAVAKSPAGQAVARADSLLFSAILPIGITELEQNFIKIVRSAHS